MSGFSDVVKVEDVEAKHQYLISVQTKRYMKLQQPSLLNFNVKFYGLKWYIPRQH